MKYQYVFSMRTAGALMTKGYRLLELQQNHKFPTKDVYVFEQTEELMKELQQMKDSTKEINNGSYYKRS